MGNCKESVVDVNEKLMLDNLYVDASIYLHCLHITKKGLITLKAADLICSCSNIDKGIRLNSKQV